MFFIRFSKKCQDFSVSEKMYLQSFLHGNHPNDLLIMKVIDQIMGLCTLMVQPRLWKFTKTFPEIHLMISQNFAVIGCMDFESIEYRQTDIHAFIFIYDDIDINIFLKLLLAIC